MPYANEDGDGNGGGPEFCVGDSSVNQGFCINQNDANQVIPCMQLFKVEKDVDSRCPGTLVMDRF